jgi:hypothetical protein
VALRAFFSLSKTEDRLAPIAIDWLRKPGMTVYEEVDMGPKRADLVGIMHTGMLSRLRIVAIEIKNALKELSRGADQMVTFGQYAHETYLACTPYMALEVLEKHSRGRMVSNWDSHELEARLSRSGIGLLLIVDDKAIPIHQAKRYTPGDHKIEELRSALKEKNPI